MKWREFEEEFKKSYLPLGMQYSFLDEMSIATQRPDETGLDFIYRVLELRNRVDMHVDVQQIMHILVRGLSDTAYKQTVSKHRDSLETVIALIKAMDSVQEIPQPVSVAKTSPINTYVAPPPPPLPQNSERKPVPVENNQQNKPRSAQQQGFNPVCANCDQVGHRHSECTHPWNQEKIDKFYERLKIMRAGNQQQNINTNLYTIDTDMSQEENEDVNCSGISQFTNQ